MTHKYLANTSKLVIAKVEILEVKNDLVYFRSIIEGIPSPCIISSPLTKFKACTFDTIEETIAYMGIHMYNKYPNLDFNSGETILTSIAGYSVYIDTKVIKSWIEIGIKLHPEKFI